MRVLVAAFIFVAGMAAHWWWSTYLMVWGLGPHLLIIMTVAIAAERGPIVGQCYGFAWGLFLDTAGVHCFGANALVLTAAAYLVGNTRRQMDVSSPLSQAMMAVVVSWGHLLALALLGMVFERGALWPGWSAGLAVPLLNGLAAPFVFPLVERAWGRP
ncbi:MAG: rod shape-determining protein MreD [Elusimicrobia bacterium]|nr:rod shape-determining protein MreD [Elusimicrobiota bacterium]